MNTFKDKIFCITVFFVLFLLVSCTSNSGTDHFLLSKDSKAITVDVQVLEDVLAESNTRANKDLGLNSLNENIIQNITAFLFDTNGNLFKIFEKEVYTFDGKTLKLYLTNNEADVVNGTSLELILVANSTVDSWDSVKKYSDLQNITQVSELNTGSIQDDFLMVGSISTGKVQWNGIIDPYFKIAKPIFLSRAASKIQASITNIDIVQDGVKYDVVGTPSLILVNYTNTTSIVGSEKVKKHQQRISENYPLVKVAGSSSLSTEVPFYSYEVDWSMPSSSPNAYDSEREVYLILELMIKSGNLDPKPYYYRIPVNYNAPIVGMSSEDKNNLHKLKRNYLYKISSSIHVLGSEDPGVPLEIDAQIAVQPRTWISDIDGNISKLDYLSVKEKEVEMPYINTYKVEYQSNEGVVITIDEVSYKKYDRYGKNTTIKKTGNDIKSLGIKAVSITEKINVGGKNSQKTYIKIDSPIPTNNVPWTINITVKHSKNNLLKEKIKVTQYPDKYITGKTSTGWVNSFRDPEKPYADFRYHDTLGEYNQNRIAQTNNTLYKVTTLVATKDEIIGDPVADNQATKRDAVTNRMISPEFIIASQHGLSTLRLQFEEQKVARWRMADEKTQNVFADNYGPQRKEIHSTAAKGDYYTVQWYTENGKKRKADQSLFNDGYKSARERCATYFEDEYGTDGHYAEDYINTKGEKIYRFVKKKFKYQGRWRLPTAAELKYINDIQKKQGSAVEALLLGEKYWTGETGKAYNFTENSYTSPEKGYVRCVFDTWKLK